MNTQIEHVARAFYDALYGEGIWESEFEELKAQFRDDAVAAIALLDQAQYCSNDAQMTGLTQGSSVMPFSCVYGAA